MGEAAFATPEQTERTLDFAGAQFVLDPSGALWWPDEGTLVAADLHLEKGSAFARRGCLLPPYDSRATLRALLDVVAVRRPRQLVLLGDSFHDPTAADRLDPAARALMRDLGERTELVFVSGNHDPHPPRHIAPRICEALVIAGVRFVHIPGSGAAPSRPEIAGHLHPVAKAATRAGIVRRRCFVSDARRMVLPALGAFAGGLNVKDEAFAALFAAPPRVDMLGRARVFQVAFAGLRPD